MSTKISDIISFMEGENLFPLEKSLSFDNPGLLAGSRDEEVSSIVLVLDLSSDAINLAVEKNAKLIITHHPSIFGGIKNINCENATGKLLWRLGKEQISLYACHTNLDANHEYSNKVLARTVGINESDIYTLEDVSIGVFAKLDNEGIKLSCLANKCKEGLDASGISTICDKDAVVKKAFVQGGSFDEDMINVLVREGVDVVISGEIKHHVQVALNELGICSLACGHNASERIFMPELQKLLCSQFADVNFYVDLGKETTL